MPKVNVYLPDELAEKVRQLDLPISRVCQDALQKKVDRMQTLKQAKKDTKAVADRLRATRDEEEETKYQLGVETGIEWAQEIMTARELQDIAELASQFWITWEPPGSHSVVQGLGVAEELCDEIGYDYRYFAGLDNYDKAHFEADAFMRGFMKGATEVWNEVANLI